MALSLFFTKCVAVGGIVVFDTVCTFLPLCLSTLAPCGPLLQAFNSVAGGLMMGFSVLELVNNDGVEARTLTFASGVSFTIFFLTTFFLHFFSTHRDEMFTREVHLADRASLSQRLLLRLVIARSGDSVPLEEKDDPGPVHSKDTRKALFVWTIIISIESCFSCMVLGCQTSARLVWIIFVAIIASDWAECIVLGQHLHNARFARGTRVAIIAFVQGAAALGFFLGLLTELLSTEIQLIISRLLFAALSGVFLYISLVDMIMKELGEQPLTRRQFFIKCILIYVGLAIAIIVNSIPFF